MRLGCSGSGALWVAKFCVDFLADCPELTLLELADLDATPAFGGANECGVNQLQDGACAQGMRDDPRRREGTAPNQSKGEEQTMRRMIGMDIHRTEGFGRSLGKEDEVVIEAAGNAMAVVHVPSPYVARVLAANPLQVKAIACARQDGQDRCRCAGIAAGRQFSAGSLVAGFGYRAPAPIGGTPQSGSPAPHADQEPGARDPARPSDPPCPHAHLFARLGRIWLAQQLMPDDEGAAIERHRRELDRLSGDLGALDTQIAQAGSDDPAVSGCLRSPVSI